jgi:hypothetical protein
MALPHLPTDPSRADLVPIVAFLMDACGESEGEDDEVYRYLGRHLPDPQWSDIIFWPSHHAETRAMGIDESTRPGLDAEQVVEIAFRYRPIAL